MAQPTRADHLVETAKEALRHHRRAEALDALRRAVELAPDHAEAVGLLGDCLFPFADEQSVTAYERAAALAPQEFHWHFGLGRSLRELGRRDEAASALNRAAALAGEDAERHAQVGSALFGIGCSEQAAAEYAEAIRRVPDVAEWHLALGQILLTLGRRNEGVTALKAGGELGRNDPAIQHRLAITFSELSLLDQAEVHAREAIRLMPLESEFQHTLGVLLMQAGKPAEALGAFYRARELSPSLLTTLNLGEALAAAGRNVEALHVLREALGQVPDGLRPEWKPTASHVHLLIARVLVQMGQSTDALRELQAAVNLDPLYDAAAYELGEVLAVLGRFDEARQEWERALGLVRDDQQLARKIQESMTAWLG